MDSRLKIAGNLLFVELDALANIELVSADNKSVFILYAFGGRGKELPDESEEIQLPPGKWKLLGPLARMGSKEFCKQIADPIPDIPYEMYQSYGLNNVGYSNPWDSVCARARSLDVNPDYAIVLLKLL